MILVTGGSGMLGRSFVVAMSGTGSPSPVCLAPSHQDLDITSEPMVWGYVKKHHPEAIINCAAMTDVDGCESNASVAEKVNGYAVGHLAMAAKRFHSKFIHISTDYVFDGKNPGLISESDQTNPIQVYGKTKLIGEQLALESGGTVARVQWLFGRNKKNFISWVIGNVQQNNAMKISKDQIGCPSGTDWIARTILLMISSRNINGGIYHVVHDDYASRFECASCAITALGVANVETFLIPSPGTKFGAAERPIRVCLDCSKLKRDLDVPTLGSWKTDVSSFVINNWRFK